MILRKEKHGHLKKEGKGKKKRRLSDVLFSFPFQGLKVVGHKVDDTPTFLFRSYYTTLLLFLVGY